MIAPAEHAEVIHLVAAPEIGRVMPAVLCAKAIDERLTPPGTVVLIADASGARYAHALGLRPDLRLSPPLGNPEMLVRRIRRLARGAARVICWNDELAMLLGGGDAETDLISTRPLLAPPKLRKRIKVRVFERSDRDIWEARDHSAEVDTVLAPIVDNLAAPRNPLNRTHLGIDPAAICVGIIADHPSDIDAREMSFLFGLLHASGYRLAGVFPRGANHLPAARRHHRALGEPFQLLIAREPITTILPLFDAVIHPCFDASGASMLLERMCDNTETPVLRLRSAGREGLSRAPSVAGPIIDYFDEMLRHRQETNQPVEPIHA